MALFFNKTNLQKKSKIIDRYLRREFLQVVCFLITIFFFLYILIDYSVHLKMFNQGQLSYGKIVLYYLWQLSQHLTILLPLALMIATIKVLTSMNVHGELSALFSAGISFKRLYRPFIQIAWGAVLLTYANIQFIQPLSSLSIQKFEQKHLKNIKSSFSDLKALPLDDNSLLVYQNFDEKTKCFSNVFLVSTFNEVYRMKTLCLQKSGAQGKGVDVLIRNHANKFVKKETRPICFFSKVIVDVKNIAEKDISPRMQPLSILYKKISSKSFSISSKINDKTAESTTYFSYKLLISWLSLLSVLAPPCLCLKFHRSFPLFFIYGGFLFAFFGCIAIINACIIISSHQILPPFWGLFFVFLPLFSYVGFRYRKMTK